jgi:hypothetical protein
MVLCLEKKSVMMCNDLKEPKNMHCFELNMVLVKPV